MQARSKTVRRLAALHQVVEQAHGLELDAAVRALHEVEAEIRRRLAAVERLRRRAGQALRTGDREGWLIDDAERQFSEWNQTALDGLRQTRDAAMQAAAEVYKASRMQLEQMLSLERDLKAKLDLERGRAEQRQQDDRYLSRRRWVERERLAREGVAANGVSSNGNGAAEIDDGTESVGSTEPRDGTEMAGRVNRS